MFSSISLKHKLRSFLKRFDHLFLIISLPLIPMLIAEFFIGIDDATLAYFNVYYVALWFVFTFEFFSKFYLAKDKFTYVKENWLDALVVLAPVFRSFKVFHLLRTPILLVSDEIIKFFKEHKFNFLYIFISTLVLLLITADIVLFFEKADPTSNIKTFEDAVWWGFVTFSTLGYGDKVPVTFGGRIVAVLLMTLGFALFSIIVGGTVSFFMRKSKMINGKSSIISAALDEEKNTQKLEEISKRMERLEMSLEKALSKKPSRGTKKK